MRADRYRLSKWNTVDRMAVIIENWSETDSRLESRRIFVLRVSTIGIFQLGIPIERRDNRDSLASFPSLSSLPATSTVG